MEHLETFFNFHGDYNELARKVGNSIVQNRIKCKNCGNISRFNCLSNYQNASIYKTYTQNQEDVHWASDYLYLLSCPECKQFHLCKFNTTSENENLYEMHIEMCIEADSTGDYYNFGNPFDRCNFEIVYPQYTDSELLKDEIIKDKFPEFIEIYHQAQKAEKLSLNKISGMAYRKALEFLIKDFAIYKNPENKKEISSISLHNCINSYYREMSDIKECAKRAAWLGNDETHYTRKWKEKDISDLKNLIDIVMHGVRLNILKNKYINEMKK